MKKLVFAVSLLATLSAADAATAPKAPKWCKPCLYYSGDTDTAHGDGLWNGYNSAYKVDGQVFSAFKDSTKTVNVTGGAINSWSDAIHTITNPTPYQINTGMSVGNGGSIVCSGSAKAKVIPTGRVESTWGVPYEYSIYLKKLEHVCPLKKGTYWLLIYPQSDSSLWYESAETGNVNHVGWKNLRNRSLFNSTYFGMNYESAGSGDFSFGLTGR